jgi:hypothetical protein
VVYVTFKTELGDDAGRAALDVAARSQGASIAWRRSVRTGRAYGLCELSDAPALAAMSAAGAAIVEGSPVIALAVFPTVPEALPQLLQALGENGRPAGIGSVEACDGGAIVEWNLERTGAAVVLAAIDVELARFHSGRTAELLSPLPPGWLERLAADGLKTPEIAPDRVLETLIERAAPHA